MKSILLLIFLISRAMALPWETNFHHIEPMMEEANEVINNTNPICTDKPKSLITYISDKPRIEEWRKYYKMPKLLSDKMYKVKEVCEDAKKQNAADGVSKRYALVAHKTHLCDLSVRACLSTLKSISDPCNNFIQDNFQVYHTRTTIGSHKVNKMDEILDEYGHMGPSLLVIDLETCTLMPTKNTKKIVAGKDLKPQIMQNEFYTPPSKDSARDEKGEYDFKSENDQVRFTAMKNSLINNIPNLKIDSPKMDCFENGKRSLPSMKDLEEIPYGEMKVKGVIGIRKLMDEQYIDMTGINPYNK